ncbi:MAG: galactokinase [Actinomycetota bacterium]
MTPAPDPLPGRLREAAGRDADRGFRAPGRANLIGEHTDYNDGFVLPVALEMSTYLLGRAGGGEVRLRSLEASGEVVVDVSTGAGPAEGWGSYVTGVVRALLEASVPIGGFEGVIASDVPVGSGLSSSAALEVAVASALVRGSLDPVRLAEICQRAENEYVGVRCGIMDQLTSAAGREGHALLIDCRSHDLEPVPVPGDLSVLVIDSAVSRGLGDSAYNERRAQCEEAARALGVPALRDATVDDLERGARAMDEVVYRRARHVVTENARVHESAEALRAGDAEALRRLFEDSHRSYAQDFEASSSEIDRLVAVAGATPGVVAARLTGGGFGGSTVNLVVSERAQEAARHIVQRYAVATGLRARAWISRASPGAGPLAVGASG